MKIQAFSLMEMIFAVLIVSLISSFAIITLNDSVNSSTLVKIRSDIAFIRTHIAKYENKKILMQEEFDLYSLDDASINSDDQKLFTNILNNDMQIISKEDHQGSWIKIANNTYQVKIDESTYGVFEYDYSKKKFECDMDQDWCVSLNQ